MAKVVAVFPHNIRSWYGESRWAAFQRATSDAFTLLCGAETFWEQGQGEDRVLVVGRTWEEESAETKRVLAGARADAA
jgi:hypothetical protein